MYSQEKNKKDAPNRQLEHHEHHNSRTHYPISLLMDNLGSPMNVGSIFRIADALGVSQLYLCGSTTVPPNSKIRKISRSAERYVKFSHHQDAVKLCHQLLEEGCLLVALEISTASVDIRQLTSRLSQELTPNAPMCIILGGEKLGVDQRLLDLCQHSAHIPMLGNNSSMNVANACAIAVFELSRLYHSILSESPD